MAARTREIQTNQLDLSCDVCGRTLLRGERAEPFLAGGSRRQVCELCTTRAQAEGWIREGAGDPIALAAARHDGRGRSVWERLRGRRARAAEPSWEPPAEREHLEDPDRVVARAAGDLEEVAAPAPEPAPAAPPAPRARRRPRHVRAVPTNLELKMQRALEVFNLSEHTRTVGGVARSLGAPAVTVRPLEGQPSVVSIAVVWELSWYRYEIDLSDEAMGVRRVGQGDEVSELDPLDQAANAAADERGGLHLPAPATG
jgi:hypothetical protein